MRIELLQELGLNKYEAEAYSSLLAHGPLTGYELGKRSQVPLPRSYDVLEQLCQRGLALVQPGEPVRYKALEPELFLSQKRATMEKTLATLGQLLTTGNEQTNGHDFWVVRGRTHILERVRQFCESANSALSLVLPAWCSSELVHDLDNARQRGCKVSLESSNSSETTVLVLRDNLEGLVGTVGEQETGQAIVSANAALLLLLDTYFHFAGSSFLARTPMDAPSPQTEPRDWLEWENRKQQRLASRSGQRIA